MAADGDGLTAKTVTGTATATSGDNRRHTYYFKSPNIPPSTFLSLACSLL